MIKVVLVKNSGDLKSEHVFLQVDEDCNLGDYVLTDSTYGSHDKPSNKLRHVFFFPRMDVKKGDYVSLWTKEGTYEKATTTTKKPLHRLYWGLKETVWNIDGDKAFLLTAPRARRSEVLIPPKKE